MKQRHFTARSQWRKWLARNHDKEESGIWLVFHKKETGKPSIAYEDSAEEALCFGWIDSIIKKIDDERYCRKFTPRRNTSRWSKLNKKRVKKLIKSGLMTAHGLARIEAAKSSGQWENDSPPVVDLTIPAEFSAALKRNRKAGRFFAQLSPTCQNQFIGWIAVAKRQETKDKRIRESIQLLEKEEKLGLK